MGEQAALETVSLVPVVILAQVVQCSHHYERCSRGPLLWEKRPRLVYRLAFYPSIPRLESIGRSRIGCKEYHRLQGLVG